MTAKAFFRILVRALEPASQAPSMANHTVEQGDCMSSIAKQYGFNWKTLWNHPKNASLKELRKDPNVLFCGDLVYVPPKQEKSVFGDTAERHVYKLKDVPAILKVRLMRNGKPRAGEDYTLVIDGTSLSGKTDGDGWVKQPIPPDAKQGMLTLKGGREQYQLKLGHLDPISETSGVQARLKNLGLYMGAVDGKEDSSTTAAITAFQKSKGLSTTGKLDGPTKSALNSAHGS